MVNFCPKCGGKVKPDDKFCQNCGMALIESVEVPKEEVRPKIPLAPVQPPKPSKSKIASQIIGQIFGLIIGLLILYLIFYSYNCATGKYPDTQDRACQSIYQTFSGGGARDMAHPARLAMGKRVYMVQMEVAIPVLRALLQLQIL